ncbi:MAG: helix-turn-helix domain-containing protein [Rhodospirillaceae bacterium]|nr:helix-turn-helix domain-containing protein [Rhodospirillaceae bacterium]
MTTKKTKKPSKLMQGARELLAYVNGDTRGARVSVVYVYDVKAIRKRLDMSQREFAQAFALPLDTVRDWEAGRSGPDQAAKVLLSVIAAKPKVVQQVVARSFKEG